MSRASEESVASLAALRNLGQVSARRLLACGIDSPEALERLGAVAAYRRVQARFPGQTSRVLLYALHGALLDAPWELLPPDVRERLLEELANTTPEEET